MLARTFIPLFIIVQFAAYVATEITSPISSHAYAQEPSVCQGANCESWVMPPSADTPVTSANALPECKKSDELQCNEECRREFDAAFHTCQSDCLRAKCSQPAPAPKTNSAGGDPELCIEYETEGCESECAQQRVSSERAKCRRNCLAARCPESGRYQRAMEGLNPGSSACRRCEAQYTERCARQCRSATYRMPSNSLPELRGLGCERVCITSACGASCGVRLPF